MKKGGAYLVINNSIIDELNIEIKRLEDIGYKLLYKSKEKSMNDTYFKAVICMIANLTELKCISYNTYSGFIFYLKSSKTYFKKKINDKEVLIDEILLKVSLIGENNEYNYKDYLKSENNKKSIIDEATIQQNIYNISGNYEITPSILDCTIIEIIKKKNIFLKLILDSYIKSLQYSPSIIGHINDYFNHKSKLLINNESYNSQTGEYEYITSYDNDIIKSIIELEDEEKEIIDILKFLKHKPSISIITMDYATNFISLRKFLQNFNINTRDNREQLYRIYGYLFAIILFIYITTGTIHLDLHRENILIHKNLKEDTNIRNNILIIDFGIIKIERSTLNERYLEFFDNIESRTITDMNHIKVFYETHYKYLFLKLPDPNKDYTGIFSIFQNSFIYNEIFLNYFQIYTNELFENISAISEIEKVFETNTSILNKLHLSVITKSEKSMRTPINASKKIQSSFRRYTKRKTSKL